MNTGAGEERYDAYVGRVARGAGISYVGQGLGRVLAYVTQVAVARMYGPAQLGFYALGVTVVGFANILAQFGLQNATLRYTAQYQAERDVSRMRGTILLALGVSFALSLALSVLMFLGADLLADKAFNKPLMEAPLRAFSISVPFFTLMSMALWATAGFQTEKYNTLVRQILQPLLNLVLIVAFYLLGAQVLGAVAAYVVSMAASSALAVYYLVRMFPGLLDRNTPPAFESRAIFNDASLVFVGVSAEYLNAWTGIIALGILATGEEVGIFNAAARTAMVSGVVYMAFTIFSPIISSLYARGRLDDLSYLYRDVSRWIFTSGLVVFLVTVLLSRDILAVFGEEFVAGWIVMDIVAGGQLFSTSIGATNRVLLMTGYQKIYMLAMIAAAVTGLIASFMLIPIYGILGAALSCTGTTVLANTITLAAIRKEMSLWPYSRQYLKPLTAGLVAVVAILLTRLLLPVPDGILAILVLAPLLLVVFAAMLLSLGLSSSDWQLLKAIWMAVRRAV